MAFDDLRGFLAEAKRIDQLREVRGADWNLEVGGITDITCHIRGSSAILFDEIKGYPPGYRIATNLLGTRQRFSLAIGVEPGLSDMELVQVWRDKMKNLKLTPPVEVTAGPILENVHDGDDIDLLEFPAPRYHELDGGRYLGTGCQVITRDPDSGYVNVGTYRGMVQGKAALGNYMDPNKHARVHRQKYWERGEPCPVVVVFGCDPRFFIFSTTSMPYGTSEYDFYGGLVGEPVPVVIGEHTGLPIPAFAEIAIEGEMREGDILDEGPFGEWTGYYASGMRQEPVIRVSRVMHRNDPIIHGAPPVRPPSTYSYPRCVEKSAIIWNALEAAGVPHVKAVWSHEAGATFLFNVVAIRQSYPGHAKQAGLIASQCQEGINAGRWVIVVDEDVDVSDLGEVIWAMSTRTDPATAMDVIRRTLAGPLDPAYPPGPKHHGSRAIVEATRPFEWLQDFSPVVRVNPEREKALRAQWAETMGWL